MLKGLMVIIMCMLPYLEAYAIQPPGDVCVPRAMKQKQIMSTIKALPMPDQTSVAFDAEAYMKWTQAYVQQLEKMRPSVGHCKKGDWIPVTDKITALKQCDFDNTSASASAIGFCKYRGNLNE